MRGPASGRNAGVPGAGGRKRGLFAALAEARSAEIARLAAEAARALGCGGGLGAAETVLRAGLLRLGGSMLGQLLSADPGQRGPRLPCGQGHEAEFTDYRDKVIDTVLGPVTLRRAWYHRAECKHGFAPRDAELGVEGTSLSPGLAAMNDIAAAAGPFAKAAGLLEDLAGVRLTAKRVERSAEASGTAKAAADRSRAQAITARTLVPLPPSPLPDKRYAAIDGTGVPVTAKEAAGRAGKGEDGRARTREVKLAVFFTQDKVDEDGYPVRDRDSSSYLATFEPASVFAGLVEAEGIRRGARHIRQFTILGDGAAWIWNIAAAKFPEATQVVDLFHAREHLHDLARVLEFMLGDQRESWLAARLEDLDYGDIDGICAAARAYHLTGVKKDERDKALGYFENNAPRMRYKWFRSRGLFVGSGVVEAGCKAIVGQRLKLSGMRWTVAGADAIIALRCREASSQWEQIWQRPRSQTATA
ncbi:MAG: ISKra4 family transposase [Streptosporangiaceae bacterium]